MKKESKMLELIESEDIPLLSMNKDFDGEDLDINDIKYLIRDYHNRKNNIQ